MSLALCDLGACNFGQILEYWSAAADFGLRTAQFQCGAAYHLQAWAQLYGLCAGLPVRDCRGNDRWRYGEGRVSDNTGLLMNSVGTNFEQQSRAE